MVEFNKFDFKKYDVGGTDSNANDGRLTGSEVAKAKADGWTVWDGCQEGDKIEQLDQGSKQNSWFKTLFNMWNSDSHKEYSKLVREILEEKLSAQGIYPSNICGAHIYNVDDILFNPVYKQAKKEAKIEAKQRLGLSEDAFTIDRVFENSPIVENTDKSNTKII